MGLITEMEKITLQELLTGLKLSSYIDTFEIHGFSTIDDCKTGLDEDTLLLIGIDKPGHRKRILNEIKRLNSSPQNSTVYRSRSTDNLLQIGNDQGNNGVNGVPEITSTQVVSESEKRVSGIEITASDIDKVASSLIDFGSDEPPPLPPKGKPSLKPNEYRPKPPKRDRSIKDGELPKPPVRQASKKGAELTLHSEQEASVKDGELPKPPLRQASKKVAHLAMHSAQEASVVRDEELPKPPVRQSSMKGSILPVNAGQEASVKDAELPKPPLRQASMKGAQSSLKSDQQTSEKDAELPMHAPQQVPTEETDLFTHQKWQTPEEDLELSMTHKSEAFAKSESPERRASPLPPLPPRTDLGECENQQDLAMNCEISKPPETVLSDTEIDKIDTSEGSSASPEIHKTISVSVAQEDFRKRAQSSNLLSLSPHLQRRAKSVQDRHSVIGAPLPVRPGTLSGVPKKVKRMAPQPPVSEKRSLTSPPPDKSSPGSANGISPPKPVKPPRKLPSPSSINVNKSPLISPEKEHTPKINKPELHLAGIISDSVNRCPIPPLFVKKSSSSLALPPERGRSGSSASIISSGGKLYMLVLISRNSNLCPISFTLFLFGNAKLLIFCHY